MYNNVPVPNICDMIRVHVYHMAAGLVGLALICCNALVVYYVHIEIDRQ